MLLDVCKFEYVINHRTLQNSKKFVKLCYLVFGGYSPQMKEIVMLCSTLFFSWFYWQICHVWWKYFDSFNAKITLSFITHDPFERRCSLLFDILVSFHVQKWGTNQKWPNCLSFLDSLLASAAHLIKPNRNGLTWLQKLAIYLKRTIWPFLFYPPFWDMKEDQNIKKQKYLLEEVSELII